MKTKQLDRSQLTTGQLSKLQQWEKSGMPTMVIKLGYSRGSNGNNNFHSTWAYRSGKILRIYGDGRATWRKIISEYGFENVTG